MSSRTRPKGKLKEIEIISLVSSEDEEEDAQNALSTPLDSASVFGHGSNFLLNSGEKSDFCLYITNKNVKVVYLDSCDDSRFDLTELNHFKRDGDCDRFLISGGKSEIVFHKMTETVNGFKTNTDKNNRVQSERDIEKQVFSPTEKSLRNGPVFDRTDEEASGSSISDEEVLNDSQYDEGAAHGSTANRDDSEEIANNDNQIDAFTADGHSQADSLERSKIKSLHPVNLSDVAKDRVEDYLHIENSNNWSENSPYSDSHLEENRPYSANHLEENRPYSDSHVDENSSDDIEEYKYEDLESEPPKNQQHDSDSRLDVRSTSDALPENEFTNSTAQVQGLNEFDQPDAAEHEVPSANNDGIFKSDNEHIDGKELTEARLDDSKSSDGKSKLYDDLKNDLFAFVSSEDEAADEGNAMLSVEQKTNTSVNDLGSVSNKRKASEMSDDDSNDLSDEYDEQSEKTNLKATSALDSFFDDNDDEDSKIGNETKSPSAALPLLSKAKTPPIIVKRIRTSLSSIIGDRASPNKTKTSELKDSKVRVSIISQMTGLEKCILVIDIKQRKPLKSILPKAINAILQQNNKLPTAVSHNESNCFFYHNQIKLSPHNTINDLGKNSNDSTIELLLVSQDKEASLFESDYKLLQTMQQQEEKMKIMADKLKKHGLSNKDEEWAQKLANLKEEQIQAEISDGENVSGDDEKNKDGFFNIKLLDKSNKPITVSVHAAMTVQDVFNLYKENKVVALNAKVTIMFDGDVVALTDSLNYLGLEDDDMLEFSIT